jgi:hypothetical protein
MNINLFLNTRADTHVTYLICLWDGMGWDGEGVERIGREGVTLIIMVAQVSYMYSFLYNIL